MNGFRHPVRWSITGIAVSVLVIFAVRDAQMGSVSVNPGDLMFVFAIYGIPLAIFMFTIWTGRWAELRGGSAGRNIRQMIAVAAEISGAVAPGMFLLNLPLWTLLAAHESFATIWIFTGALASIVAVLCALVGSPLLWRHAIASALLLPLWFVNLGLLAKAMMD